MPSPDGRLGTGSTQLNGNGEFGRAAALYDAPRAGGLRGPLPGYRLTTAFPLESATERQSASWLREGLVS